LILMSKNEHTHELASERVMGVLLFLSSSFIRWHGA
jgi:hypothetical protein